MADYSDYKELEKQTEYLRSIKNNVQLIVWVYILLPVLGFGLFFLGLLSLPNL